MLNLNGDHPYCLNGETVLAIKSQDARTARPRVSASSSVFRMVRRHLSSGAPCATLACAVLLLGGGQSGLQASLRATAANYLADIGAIAPVAGRDTTYDYYERLHDDSATLADPAVPQGYTPDEWAQTVERTASLDLSLAQQLIDRNYSPMQAVRGLGEVLIRSSADGTMQPAAVYVPKTYAPNKRAPLVVLLHGHPQSETALLAPPYLEHLAERTGTIVIAPWGRGYYDFRGSVSDVYDALREATRAFAIDPRKRYLAGYSMGGFSVFEVAPVHPDDWSAVMCIAGALLGSDASRVVTMMRRTPFYVLTGVADDSIPTQYPTATAAFLQSSGLDVSFYSEPGGTHRLVTILPILTQAWSDMLAEIVRRPPPRLGNVVLPTNFPTSSLKP
jgi:pimeloyl-ACP methyl ester carboxylesterase